jgi:hypothetical protein
VETQLRCSAAARLQAPNHAHPLKLALKYARTRLACSRCAQPRPAYALMLTLPPHAASDRRCGSRCCGRRCRRRFYGAAHAATKAARSGAGTGARAAVQARAA